jgi:hypothetical protein
MGVPKQNPWLSGLGVLFAVLAVYIGQARADVTSDTPGSIVIYPKVIADGTRDTLIQLTNTSNMGTSVHCFYLDGTSIPPCRNDDFFVDLTPQQPIFWRASTGRRPDDGTPGLFLGLVPRRINFQGELKCVQVDSSGVPIGGNAFKGEALLETLKTGQVSEYNAIAIQNINNPGLLTCLAGARNGLTCTSGQDCCDASGANCGTCAIQLRLDGPGAGATSMYNACPRELLVTHYAQGANDLFTGATVNSEITLVPCTEDLEANSPIVPQSPPVIGNVTPFNEMELLTGSRQVAVSCWANLSLGDVAFGGDGLLGSGHGGIYDSNIDGTFVMTRIRTSSAANSGLLGVLEEFHCLNDSACGVLSQDAGSAAVNLHGQGSRSPGDVITLPQN